MREIRIDGLCVVYNEGEPTEIVALNLCTLKIFSGRPLVICGANGSGKTTLLKVLAGKIRPRSGSVELVDVEAGLSMYADLRWLREHVEYVPQKPIEGLFPDLTLAEHLALGARCKNGVSWWDPYVPSASFKREEEAFATLMPKYKAYKHRRVMDLSGGEQQLFMLALAQYGTRSIILLDEPTASLDKSIVSWMDLRINSWLRRPELFSVLVTHDAMLAGRLGFESVDIEACMLGREVEGA